MFYFLYVFFDDYVRPYIPFLRKDKDYKPQHLNKIHKAGKLMENTELPIEMRVNAARDLGILCYTGHHEDATQAAENYMQAMLDLLRIPELSQDHIISVMEGLSRLCFHNNTNQKKAQTLGLCNILQEFVTPDSPISIKAKFWSCHLLNILCCNNFPLIRHLKDSEDLHHSLEQLVHLDWSCWPSNYAKDLLYLLWFQKPSENDLQEQ